MAAGKLGISSSRYTAKDARNFINVGIQIITRITFTLVVILLTNKILTLWPVQIQNYLSVEHKGHLNVLVLLV